MLHAACWSQLMASTVEGKKRDGVVGAAAGAAVLSIFYVLIDISINTIL